VEDAFHRIPVHWMWWPAIGALAVVILGIFPGLVNWLTVPAARALLAGLGG
jgi:hypothetical protein